MYTTIFLLYQIPLETTVIFSISSISEQLHKFSITSKNKIAEWEAYYNFIEHWLQTS